MLKTETGKFVNLVASVDRKKGVGKILYVNPSTVATMADVAGVELGVAPSPFDAFEISIQDSGGRELRRFHPTIQVSNCEGDGPPETGMVNEDIPVLEGMKRVALLHKGVEVSHFEAGESRPALERAAGTAPLSLSAPLAVKPNRRGLSTAAAVPAKEGVTYTVQVKPEGASAWQTIAVGRQTPNAEIDRNQFPGSKAAMVRVLRSTGFEDEIFSEQEIDLNY
ncbi:MAG: hypothetical protein E8D46_17750 [Nitrospira sp.]|nr:MAG: hypothetical protein E8D46_17750 [Nitrospira sp.]